MLECLIRSSWVGKGRFLFAHVTQNVFNVNVFLNSGQNPKEAYSRQKEGVVVMATGLCRKLHCRHLNNKDRRLNDAFERDLHFRMIKNEYTTCVWCLLYIEGVLIEKVSQA